jgi:PadR family transcriptional regulator PadR
MDDSSGRKFQKELNGGLVGLVLLAVLAGSDEDLYGYEIAKRLASANEGTPIFKEGTIYPVLRALSAGELLTSRIVPSYAGPPRRYYRITEQGRGVLAEWKVIWRGTRDFVDRFIEAVGGPEASVSREEMT